MKSRDCGESVLGRSTGDIWQINPLGCVRPFLSERALHVNFKRPACSDRKLEECPLASAGDVYGVVNGLRVSGPARCVRTAGPVSVSLIGLVLSTDPVPPVLSF